MLGPILPASLRATGLDPGTPVLCGIHDFNASLLPHLHRPAQAVRGGLDRNLGHRHGDRRRAVELDPARDTLVNVNAFGAPVPSARFMGGREFETLRRQTTRPQSPTSIGTVLAGQDMLMPSVQQGRGRFRRAAKWIGDEPQVAGSAPRPRRFTWR